MQRFTVENHSSLEKLYFHDAKLGAIHVSYKDTQVIIQLHDVRFDQSKMIDVELAFSGVIELHVPMKEPWGGGYYCTSLNTDQEGTGTEQFRIRLLLNSGDEISIVAEQVQLR